MHVVQRVAVAFEYPVYFTEDAFAPGNPVLAEALARKEPARRHRFVLVVDANVAAAWPALGDAAAAYAAAHRDRMELVAAPLLVPGGEAGKNDPAVLAELHAALERHAIDRQSHVVMVGGGALLDVAGYAAATCHRGVRCVRMPTTTLSQGDSGIGVKNGVNAFGKKNFLGSFAPPFAVVNDARFLDTLPRRDAIAGYAEAVKVSLLRDPDFFAWLEAEADALAACARPAVAELIRRGAALHMQHIATSGDPFETGSARPLDFGHWAAHKLESLTDNRLRHGEAVAIGLALDTIYARLVGLTDAATVERVVGVIGRLGLPRWDAAVADPALLDGLAEFREHLGGDLTITLVRAPGDPVEVGTIDRDVVRRAIDELAARARDGGAG
jgi:3-dehydroquinate synthase